MCQPMATASIWNDSDERIRVHQKRWNAGYFGKLKLGSPAGSAGGMGISVLLSTRLAGAAGSLEQVCLFCFYAYARPLWAAFGFQARSGRSIPCTSYHLDPRANRLR